MENGLNKFVHKISFSWIYVISSCLLQTIIFGFLHSHVTYTNVCMCRRVANKNKATSFLCLTLIGLARFSAMHILSFLQRKGKAIFTFSHRYGLNDLTLLRYSVRSYFGSNRSYGVLEYPSDTKDKAHSSGQSVRRVILICKLQR